MPPSATTLNDRGKWQLRNAIILVVEIINNAALQPDTAQNLRGWIEACKADDADEAVLLGEVFLHLQRAETEHNLVPALEPPQHQSLQQWLDGYLNRREISQ